VLTVLVGVTCCVALHTRIRRGVHHEPDGHLLVILQLHSVAADIADILESVHLHPLQRGVTDVVFALERPHLGHLDDIVGADPLRTEAAVVVGAGVGNILGLADEPLVARESENVELLHLSRHLLFC